MGSQARHGTSPVLACAHRRYLETRSGARATRALAATSGAWRPISDPARITRDAGAAGMRIPSAATRNCARDLAPPPAAALGRAPESPARCAAGQGRAVVARPRDLNDRRVRPSRPPARMGEVDAKGGDPWRPLGALSPPPPPPALGPRRGQRRGRRSGRDLRPPWRHRAPPWRAFARP